MIVIPLPIEKCILACWNGPGYNGQYLAVYSCEYLERLRH
jgi:hypothetical protein